MGLKCKITYINNIPVATNEAGNPSLLYRDALAYTGNATEALNIWATVSTPEYQSIFGKPQSVDDVSLEQVVKFYNASKKLDAKLTSQELFGIKQMMRSNGVSTLSEMTKLLKTVFQLGDVPSYNPNLAVATGLFLPEDLPSLDLAAISDLIVRMEGEILRNDFEIAVDQSTINYKNSGVKNILGASEPVSIEQIDEEVLDLIADPQSEASFYDRLRELPYTDFVERFYSDKAFATEYMNRFADVVKIPVVEERNGELVADVTNTFSTVKNTMLDGLDSLDIDTNIAYLESIPDTIWEQKLDNIKNIIVEIETELATKNIDIVGLNRISTDKTTILALLQATSTMVLNPSDVNIEVFSQIYDSTFLKTPTTSVQRLDKNLQGLTVIKMHSSKTAQQLFDQHGLIAVGDNLYQKVVQDENVGNLYEYLYQQMQDGNFKLPYQFSLERDMANKPAVLKDIEKYVNSRDTGLGFYNEKVSLYQLIFKHPAINRSATAQQDAALLNTLATREDYLRTDFVSDFYNYILQEKLKDSEIYRNTLSKFAITDRDITLTGTPTDLKNIEMVQELMDYFKLSTNQNVKKYILSEMRGTASESLAAINFPDLVPEFTGSKNVVGSFVATSPLTDDFIRIGEDTYQKVKQTSTASIFVKLQKPQSSAYYTTRPVFEGYSQETLDRLSNQDMVSMLKKSAADISTGKEKAGMMSTIVNRLLGRNQEARAMSAVKDEQVFTVNLVEFIRAKGISVVTDEKLIREKLAELGLDSINQMFDFQDMGVNSSLTVKINGNNVTVIPDVRSRTINTEKAAFASATRMFDKIKTYLQNTAKELYRDDMVTRSGNTITLNIKPDLKTKVEALQQLDAEILRIAEEDKKTYAAEFVEGSRTEEELERGVSEETLRDLGYNFLQTPQGSILGFEYQGTIYMDPNRLNNNTTIHELIHVFQEMLTRQALLGNTLAQSVIAKREEVFGDIAREWEAFHKQGGQPVNMQKTFNALMVGVDGGYNLNSPEGATTVVGLLNTAKKLEKVYGIQEKDWVEAQTAKGLASRVRVKNRILKDKTLTLNKEDKAAIEQATANEERVRDILLRIKYRTGWSRGADGQWRYEIEDKDAKVNLPLLKRNTGFFADEMTLEDVLNHPELYKAYPRLRNVEVVVWNDIDLADAAYSRANNVININIATLPESQIKGKFLHEVQHAIQNLEGFATVGTAEMAQMGMAGQIPGLSSEGYDTIEEAAYEGIKSIDQLVEEGKTIAEILSGDYSKYFFGDNPQALLEYYVSENPELRDIFTRSQEASPEVQKDLSNIVVTSLTETLGTKPAFDLYLNNISEVEARNVEARLALTPEERKNSLAQDTEDVGREEQITIEKGAGKTVVGNYPLFQIAGENANLTQGVLEDLQVAKRMETADKTPAEIRLATGWEKGSDGKWRFETPDNLPFLKDTVRQLKAYLFEENLDNVSQKANYFLPQELLDLYPQLKDVTIQFNKKGSENSGSYDKTKNQIDLNIGVYPQNTVSVLLHEIQHVIQNIEGFPTGGNPAAMTTKDEALQFLVANLPELTREQKSQLRASFKNQGLSISTNFYFDVISDDSNKLEDVIAKLEIMDKAFPNEDYQSVIDALDFRIMEMGGTDVAFEKYQKLAGEVESRNVERRMNMSPEQRRQTLLSQTEDIAREDQVMFQVDAYHGSPYSFDKFTTQKMGTGEGAQAFGWGLYFTDLKSIAENYADAVGKLDSYLANAVDESQISEEAKILAKGHYFESRDRNEAVKLLQYNKGLSDNKEDFDQAITFLKRFNPSRNLYKVSLHKGKTPSEYTWLIWDKKLSPEVKEKIKKGIKNRNFQAREAELLSLYDQNFNQIKDKISDKRALNFVIEKFDESPSYEKVAKELTEDEINTLKTLSDTYKELKRVREILDFDYQLNNFNGNNIYSQLRSMLGSSKEASLFLLENGIDGVKYPAESISRGATSDTARGFNYVVFDENAISIDEVVQFQMIEDLQKTIGLNLKSAAYAPRVGETDAAYHSRILTEVEAYIVAPETAANLARLQEENPSLWTEITKFIKNLTEWLKSQIGLLDYKGDVMSMTQAEYTSALGISVLKDPYSGLSTDMKNIPNLQTADKISNDMMNQSIALDSQLEILSLQTEEDQEAILDKIDNCG